MTRLVRIQTGRRTEAFIPVELVGRIERNFEGKEWSHPVAYDRDGSTLGHVGPSELNRVLQPEGVFSSPPGWYVVQSICVHEDGTEKTEISRTPIVGWCFRGSDLTPITPDDTLNTEFFDLTGSAKLLQSPDGQFITDEGIMISFINDDEILNWIHNAR